MKAAVGFIFFMLFLAGLAFVNLRGMGNNSAVEVSAASDIAGLHWRPTHIGEMVLPADNPMFVQFEPDGSLHGDTGCNRFFGQYEIAADLITLSPLGTTRKACAEETARFEQAFLDALQSMRGAVRKDDRLGIRDEAGTLVSRLIAVQTDADER